MRNQVKILLIALLAVTIIGLTIGAGCTFRIPFPEASNQIAGLDYNLIGQAWSIINRDYVDQSKINPKTLTRGAIKGMLDALNDPHSAYLSPEAYQLSNSDFQGKFEGIGAEVSVNQDKQIIIIAPIEGSPAEKAGIKPGDIILAVNGESAAGMNVTDIVLKIRGPKGTAVKVTVLHQNETEPVEMEIIRDEINASTVRLQMNGDIAYLRITEFSERTDEELHPILEKMVSQSPAGLVLDLRSNPGGILTTVINVASHFLKEGTVVSWTDNQGQTTTLPVSPHGNYIDLPTVILVDKYSASGSEVLSGALQDYHRAIIAGTTTFGKGSVNILRQLSDGSGIYITTGRWITPSGRQIEGKGIDPDYPLTLTGNDAIQWAIDFLKKKAAIDYGQGKV